MPGQPRSGSEFRAYALLSQVAMEMVVPMLIGLAVDTWLFGTLPWLTILGVVLGFGIGMMRLVLFASREDNQHGSPPTNPP
jgi:F0F1-type ATP synthase assembly protein I